MGTVSSRRFHAFPTLPSLLSLGDQMDSTLREMGFGYRAKFFSHTLPRLAELGGDGYLASLRDSATHTDSEVRARLCEFQGVGCKVADCVALFSLDRRNVVPVDVHVAAFARRDYAHVLQRDARRRKEDGETVLKKDENVRIGQAMAMHFGDYAGWAHSFLFAADLRKFQDEGKEEEAKEEEAKVALERKDEAVELTSSEPLEAAVESSKPIKPRKRSRSASPAPAPIVIKKEAKAAKIKLEPGPDAALCAQLGVLAHVRIRKKPRA
jgi:N-glycosylase/DNA lyase